MYLDDLLVCQHSSCQPGAAPRGPATRPPPAARAIARLGLPPDTQHAPITYKPGPGIYRSPPTLHTYACSRCTRSVARSFQYHMCTQTASGLVRNQHKTCINVNFKLRPIIYIRMYKNKFN